MNLFRFTCPFALALLALSAVGARADYLLDATTLAVGASPGENLVVIAGCLDPAQTSCSPRYKWLASNSPQRLGNVTAAGEIGGDFEVVVTGDFEEWQPKSIKLLNANNQGVSLNLFYTNSYWSNFYPVGLGAGGGTWSGSVWKEGDQFNELRIQVQQGVARVIINGYPYEEITFEPDTIFTRVSLEGITVGDRLVDFKVRGIQGAASVGAINTYIKTLAAADLNGDNLLDLAMLKRNTSGSPVIQIRDGRTGASLSTIKLGSDYQPVDLSLADDLDGDGKEDFAAILYHRPTGKTHLMIKGSVSKRTLLVLKNL